MKIDLTQLEQVANAADLARVLDLVSGRVKELMRGQEIFRRFETSADEHPGPYRLTFGHSFANVRNACDAHGTVLETARIKTGQRP